MTNIHDDSLVDQHYSRAELWTIIEASLHAAGLDPDRLSPEALAPLDQFHTAGRPATLALAQQVGVSAAMRVLDVGGGIGGPARTLAQVYGCWVEVLDITAEFCRVGERLTERTGLSDRVTFRHASALAMPYPDASFDLVWTQHSSMNIADKERLYSEIRRVLCPGGRLALHEIMAGEVTPVHFPVPWATEPSISHLRPPAEVRDLLTRLGFQELAWRDETARAHEWFAGRLAAMQTPSSGPPPLGLHVLLGADFPAMFHNQVRNLAEGRISVIQAIFESRTSPTHLLP